MCFLHVKMLVYTLLLTLMATFIEASIPVSRKCHQRITLDSSLPAMKLQIDFHHVFPSSCTNEVKVTESEYSIGVLLLHEPYSAVECPLYFVNIPCRCNYTHSFFIEYGVLRQYCSSPGSYSEYKLDSQIQTNVLNVEWTRGYIDTVFTILVFRFRTNCYSSSNTEKECENKARCIDNEIICEAPYKFCGDGTVLCPSPHDDYHHPSKTSNAAVIASVVLGCMFLLVFVVICFLCVVKDRSSNCYIKRLFRQRSQSAELRTDAMRIFSVQLASRGVASNNESVELSAVNIGFTEAPPAYNSLENIEESRTKALTKTTSNSDDLPDYDTVMSDTQGYTVLTSI